MDTAADPSVTIPTWANGPDGSGNGGWTAGMLAAHVDGGAAGIVVNLRVPPPIGRPLHVAQAGADHVQLRDGDVLVADAAPIRLDVDVPDAVRAISPETAASASARFPFRDVHPFPRCVACGVARDPELPTLGLHCGRVEGAMVSDAAGAAVPVFADSWIPAAEFAEVPGGDCVAAAACWSALDCPSAAPFADPHAANPSVLARFAVRLTERARVGEQYVLASWALAVDGRKQRSASVLVGAGGRVLGVAEALWIEVRPA